MECSRDSGKCWEKGLPRSQATGSHGGAWLPAERVPLGPREPPWAAPPPARTHAASPAAECALAGPCTPALRPERGRGEQGERVPEAELPRLPGLRAGGRDAESGRPFRQSRRI